LVEVDAVALTAGQLVSDGSVEAGTGWRLMLIATLSNLVFKAGVVAWRGDRALLRQVGALFGLAMLAGVALLWLWPS